MKKTESTSEDFPLLLQTRHGTKSKAKGVAHVDRKERPVFVAIFTIFVKIIFFAKIATLNGNPLLCLTHSPDFGKFSPFPPLRAFLHISGPVTTSRKVLNLLFGPKRASQAQIKPKWESAFLFPVRARKSDSEVKHSLCCHFLENDQYGTILAKNFQVRNCQYETLEWGTQPAKNIIHTSQNTQQS